MNRTAIFAAVTALAISPALAQTPAQQPEAQPAQPGAQAPAQQPEAQPTQPGAQAPAQMDRSFIESQSPNEWLASNLIGVSVQGPGDENIGSINDLLVDENGQVVGAVIGVGGFLGIGRKDVALPFEAIDLTRDADGNEQASVQLTKEELENAPDFEPHQAGQAPTTLPGGGGTGMGGGGRQ